MLGSQMSNLSNFFFRYEKDIRPISFKMVYYCISFQWPQLVSFKYKMPRKFTVDMGLKILAHLPHLRSLSLFKDIKYRCSGDFNQLKKTCRQRNIKLDLNLFVDTYLCIDGDVNGDRVSTSDESETD
jgi:hypothetical protein